MRIQMRILMRTQMRTLMRTSFAALTLLISLAIGQSWADGFPKSGKWVIENDGWELELILNENGRNKAYLTVTKQGSTNGAFLQCEEPKVNSAGLMNFWCSVGGFERRQVFGYFPELLMLGNGGSAGGAKFILPVQVVRKLPKKPKPVRAMIAKPKPVASKPARKIVAIQKPQRQAVGLSPADKQRLAQLQKKHRHAVAVIIGNKKYRKKVPQVDFAHNDADAMKNYVLNELGYRPGNIIDLRDATQAELMAVFGTQNTHEGKLFNYVRPGKSDVTVFYSGHGAPGLKDRRGYLLPVDADPNLIEINGYSVDLLFENLGKIPAKSMTVYLDACFSGDSPKGMIIRSASGLSITPRLPTTAESMVVFTAAQGDQFASWDEDAKMGLFTKHLLAALQGAADADEFGNGDGKISLSEVRTYLDDEMTYQARRRFGRQQKASIQGDPETVLAIPFSK
jgi:hypothetical protein